MQYFIPCCFDAALSSDDRCLLPLRSGYAPGTDVVLCWDTWEEASVEAGISRLMGGIHIIADHTDGEKIGFEIADMVFEKAQRLWN